MSVFIWHKLCPSYRQRMKLMNDPANVQLSIEQADQLSLVPME